ncbi:lytic murein transglycosylase [Micromonospora sp. WMMA1923]|uniref:lytic transglycosylase domain-containing protein n=1 Tax=Micromonospora sp. WMMA1923 TaxID=3404125 RepID=UPI003B9385E0
MGDTRRVADGEEDSTTRPLRAAVPSAEPGAQAPEPASTRVPRPRRPWLDKLWHERRSTAPGSDPGPTVKPEPTSTTAPAPLTTKADTTKVDSPKVDSAPVATGTDIAPTGSTSPTTTAGDAKASDHAAARNTKAGDAKTGDAKTSDAETGDAKTGDAGGTKAGDAAAGGDAPVAGAVGAVPPVVKPGDPPAGAAGATPKGGRRRRMQFAHAMRVPPRQAAVTAARATREWSQRPSGRLTLPGVFLLALVGATAAAGALLVPAATRDARPVAADVSVDPTGGWPGLPGATAVPTAPGGTPLPGLPGATAGPGLPGAGPGLPGVTPGPDGVLPSGPAAGPVATGRPADALTAWAQTTGAKVGISPVAMQAYGYAELVLAETERGCGLSWTTLAAIGFVESRHGQANGATLKSNGRAEDPVIIGLPLDGNGGRMRIADTDQGQLDGDTTYDRAVGPMQFIPTTWEEIGADADNDGVKDPHNLHDAALAAGRYLCKGGRNLTIPGDWWEAILSYNDVRRYAQDVFDTANRYGQASRT